MSQNCLSGLNSHIYDSNAALFSNKCFGDGDEDEEGSGTDYFSSRRWSQKKGGRKCSVKHPFPDTLDMLYGSGAGPWPPGPGDGDSKISKDDSLLEGPIDVESTVSSDK